MRLTRMEKILNRLFTSGDVRTARAKKNIILSAGIKACSILISLMLVPMTLGYLNEYEYGIWLTLSSVLTWINYFDIGLGNGLRNRLAEALAVGDMKKGQIYVSTTVAILTLIMASLYLLYFVCHYWLSWNLILNVSEGKTNTDLDSLVLLVLAFFCLGFILKFIGNVYLAKQMSVVNDLLTFAGNAVACIIIYILTLTTDGNLEKVALTFSIAPILVYAIAYPLTFHWKYKELAPCMSCVDFKYAKSLLALGGQFFIIQIACLVIFSTANLFITQQGSPADVTIYNIAFKYFSVVTMIFVIFITPFWSAATDAYVRKDFLWIRKSVRSMFKFWLLLVTISPLMLLLSDWVYQKWVHLTVPFSLSVLMVLYVSISNWNNLFAYFINGIGRIKLQLYCSIFSAVIFIPLAIFFGRNWGVNGVCSAMCISLLTSAVALPIQYRTIIKTEK